MGGSSKHKHKSKKKKHHHRYRSSESESEKEYTKHKHHKKNRKEKKENVALKLVDAYGSTESSSSDDDVVIVSAPPAPKISKHSATLQAPPAPKISSSHSSVISIPPSPPPPPPAFRTSRVSPKRNEANFFSDTINLDEVSQSRVKANTSQVTALSSSKDNSLSIDETNRLRAKLGLKPLEVTSKQPIREENENQPTELHGGVNMGSFVHKPAENIRHKESSEKLKEKISVRRDKRIIEGKLQNVPKLADENDSDDDVRKWVEKNRRIVSEKEKAEKRAKELDAMDEIFGIGELVEEDLKTSKKDIYTTKNLKGLKVEHSLDNLAEGKDIILTLQDKPVLADEDDTLINVNMLDDERYKKNIDRKRQKPGYSAYDDDEFDMDYEGPPAKKILRKYDEEIEKEKKDNFILGVDNLNSDYALRRQLMRSHLQQQVGKKLESLQLPTLQPATDYYTEAEIASKFKKPNRKIRKIRKPKPLKADDLLENGQLKKEEPTDWSDEYDGSKYYRNYHGMDEKDGIKPSVIKDELPDLMDTDDLPAPPDLSDVKMEDEEEDDNDLQLALRRARKVKQTEELQQEIILGQISSGVKTEKSDEIFSSKTRGTSIILNETAEFCRTLGDIPTYGHSGNRDDAQQILEFENEMKEQKKPLATDSSKTSWNEVEMDKTPVDIAACEVPILDQEPDLDVGLAGALKLAVSKGYLEKEKLNRPSASKFSHLQAQNYSIEDKTFVEDDKHSRRERFNGPTTDFKEKDGYKPNVKLDYIDDDGHLLSAKEAFRYLSHKFHGKGPGKNKIEKRMKKSEQEVLMKQMSSTDTPLGTLTMLQQKQKETQSPYIILSGSKQGQSTLSKIKF